MAFTAVTVREALDSALVALRGAGVDAPELDAEVLLAHALGVDRTQLFLDPRREVTGDAVRTFQTHVRERTVRRVPVAYLTGTKGFRHLDLHVDPRVLIPRPETEHLVEVAVARVPPGATVVDVGTGSGAVALALKQERPDLDVRATDVSADALAVARENARATGLDVGFAEGDLLAGITGADAVVTNPPYVETTARLAPELAHEPRGALFAGTDGLDVVRRLPALGVPWIAVEIGSAQGAAARACFAAVGYDTEVLPDLAGHDRIVVAWR